MLAIQASSPAFSPPLVLVQTNLAISPTFTEFQRMAGKYNVIPVWTEILADLTTPVALFNRCIGDNDGFLASGHGNPIWVPGILNFQENNRDNIDKDLLLNSKRGAMLGKYLKNPGVFKCPADKSFVNFKGKATPRVRSISMSQSFGKNPKQGGNAGKWLPFTLFYTYLKEGDMSVSGPSNLFVFLDEHPNSINDSGFAVECYSGAKARFIDYPASYHNGAGGFAFGDGHAEIKKWIDSRTVVEASFDGSTWPRVQHVSSPDNLDLAWIQERATACLLYTSPRPRD